MDSERHDPPGLSRDLDAALAEWRDLLGASAVSADPHGLVDYSQNTSSIDRRVRTAIRPRCTEQVERVVAIANKYKCPLYPISTGKNWGMGSKLPVSDNATVVDLSEMNRIREVNVSGGYAIIEPGVTQGQLYRYISERNLPAFFDVTGAASHTSIVGNIIDRGLGYFSYRLETLLGVEVVLGNGRLLRTGYWHVEGARPAHIFKYGIGPYLDGVFTQSNYGIVTAVVFSLIPAPEAMTTLICRVKSDEQLPNLVNALASLRRGGSVRSVVHCADRNRSRITFTPIAERALGLDSGAALRLLDRGGRVEWTAVATLFGTLGQVKLSQRDCRRTLRSIGKLTFVSPTQISLVQGLLRRLSFVPGVGRKRTLFEALLPVARLAHGVPSDAAMGSVYWGIEAFPGGDANPDNSSSGFLCCMPLLPFDGADAVEVVALAREICSAHAFECNITLNTITDGVLEGIINVAFDRRDQDAIRRAHHCVDAMLNEFVARGFTPSRVGIQHMTTIVSEHDSFWQTARDLKLGLDPNNIIAPGRYNMI